MNTLTFKTSINCGNCLRTVTPFLNKEESIENWSVDLNHADRILTVEGEDVDAKAVIEAVQKAGFKISVIE